MVEFLNGQMPHIEVLAVEIKQFRGKSFQTLVPRVIGRTAATTGPSAISDTRRRLLTRASFLENLPNEEARDAAKRLLDAGTAAGATQFWGSSSVSIRIPCSQFGQPVTVAWLHAIPNRLGWMGFKNIVFGAAIYDYLPPGKKQLRDCLDKYVGEFQKDKFVEYLEPKSARAWTIRYEDAAKHIDLLTSRLQNVLFDLKEM